jgi:hypothetical protein
MYPHNCSASYDETNQNKIWNVTRIASSLYTSKLMNVPCGIPENGTLNWNQSSDRRLPGHQTRYVPRRETRGRPGGMGPGGRLAKGVDIKHNSYARYLGQIKSYRCKKYKIELSLT